LIREARKIRRVGKVSGGVLGLNSFFSHENWTFGGV
jgi:hypothetical protein